MKTIDIKKNKSKKIPIYFQLNESEDKSIIIICNAFNNSKKLILLNNELTDYYNSDKNKLITFEGLLSILLTDTIDEIKENKPSKYMLNKYIPKSKDYILIYANKIRTIISKILYYDTY